MINETNLTGINEMKNGEIGEEAQVAAIIGAIAPLIEQLNGEKVTITGIGKMEGGKIGGKAKVAAIIAEPQNLCKAAAEIQQLLEQLEKSYPANTTTEKMTLATEAVKRIEANPTLRERVLSAINAGSFSALEAALNHPVASFVVNAFKDLQETGKP